MPATRGVNVIVMHKRVWKDAIVDSPKFIE